MLGKQTIILKFCTVLFWFLSSSFVASIPPQQLFPNGTGHLEDLGGGWIPRNYREIIAGGNLDEGSYWYQIYREQKQGYLVLQKLLKRTPDGKAVFQSLDVVIVPELVNSNTFGIMRGGADLCKYSNNQPFQDTRVLLLVKYNQDTATPIKSFRANINSGKWDQPPASLIKGLICELPYP